MIEVNGIYKLKKIEGLENNDESDYKVVAMFKNNLVVCEKINGDFAGSRYCFLSDFFIDPEKPEVFLLGFCLI